ncbi:MAG TPA: metallophosphoesterase [Bryobacteraceae bacterium]|nr:metallophosphoesterase [Bryobacteraceae bacterium]
MRFLHTSDWHVGLKAAWAGASAPRIVQARLDAFANVARIAAEQNPDFALIAGDLFDSHAIALSAARQAVDIIESFPCPVYVIPGNHDQDAPGALWDRLNLASLSRFRLLREPSPVPIPGGILYPCPLNCHGVPPIPSPGSPLAPRPTSSASPSPMAPSTCLTSAPPPNIPSPQMPPPVTVSITSPSATGTLPPSIPTSPTPALLNSPPPTTATPATSFLSRSKPHLPRQW